MTLDIKLQELFTNNMTPYQMCRIVNRILADVGIEKVLPAPMFYTYVKKGYIPSNKNGRVNAAPAAVWTEAYILKALGE